jgi:hypothetical protein
MAEFCTYWQVRMLMAEALRVVNEVDGIATPEFHGHLDGIRASLHSALKRIDSTMQDLVWPGPAARA